VYAALGDRDAALCIAEDEERETPDVRTASFQYYRLRKPGYTAEELKTRAAKLRESASQRDVFAFFKHEEDPQSALWAVEALKSGNSK
jgi:hypothetical protein